MDELARWCLVTLSPVIWVIGAVAIHTWWPSVSPRASMAWCMCFWPLALIAFVVASLLLMADRALKFTHRKPPIPQARVNRE